MPFRSKCAVLFLMTSLTVVPTRGQVTADDRRMVEAAKQGRLDSVRALLRQRVDVNVAERDGTTALHWAVRANQTEMVRLLIGAGANVSATTRHGITPLLVAAENGNPALAEALIKVGAKPNVVQAEGVTALMVAARGGDPETIKVLLAHGANANAAETRMGETALMWAAASNNAAASQALVEGGADPNVQSKRLTLPPYAWSSVNTMTATMLPQGSFTALMYAAREGAMNTVRVLAERADLNLTNGDGSTALILAIINAHFDTAALLVDKGANPNIADQTGMTALYAAVDMNTLAPMGYRTAPRLTSIITSFELIQKLVEHKADVNAQLKRPIPGRYVARGDVGLSEGTTPLMRAAKTADLPVMKLLLANGADPLREQFDETTVLMIAVAGAGGRGGPPGPRGASDGAAAIEVARMLLEAGVDVNAFNAAGETALQRAAARGADKLVAFLAERGARLDHKDRLGRTALDVARRPAGRQGGEAGAPPAENRAVAVLRQLMVAQGLPVPDAGPTSSRSDESQ